ncbi:hypothetical protein OPV22_033410 [Ensete ventricosum]|uniref:Magnesium chelatase ChlI-like catalytic domain-containing protein n=1 Tax=Ensete ventricosum TaxID=4639 RepID=A0AAV8Q200_ENSVE|nr:hypothetical protein OPV22_033410 [Ensete ventricosum]
MTKAFLLQQLAFPSPKVGRELLLPMAVVSVFTGAVSAMVIEKALTLLRARLYDSTYVHAAFKSCPQSNYSKLKLLSSIADAYNSSALLLGPQGSGKITASPLCKDIPPILLPSIPLPPLRAVDSAADPTDGETGSFLFT